MTDEDHNPEWKGEKDPLAEAARAPLAHRLGGAALFVATAIIGISAIRACRQEKNGPPASVTLPAPEPVKTPSPAP